MVFLELALPLYVTLCPFSLCPWVDVSRPGLEDDQSPTERDQVAGRGSAGGLAGVDRVPPSQGGGGGLGLQARGPGSAAEALSEPGPRPAPRLACSLCKRLFSSLEHLREHEYRHALSLMAMSLDWPNTQGTHGHAGPPGCQLPSSLPQPLLLHHHHRRHDHDHDHDHDHEIDHHHHHHQALRPPGAAQHPATPTATATARYFCAQCPASFTLKSNADRHEKTIHFKKKLMQCMYCLKHFRDRTDLHRHLSSVHSKERGHTCPACAKAFSTQKNLATHVKVCCQVGLMPGPFQDQPGWY